MSVEILPIVDYSLSANWYPDITESQEELSLESNLHATSYSDFTSTIYDIPNPCEVVEKKPLYMVPSDMNFSKAYIDWLLLQIGAKRKNYKVKSGQIERVLLLQFRLSLPLLAKYMDPEYWLNNTIIIPTYYVDIDTEKWMCFRFRSLVLSDYTVTVNVHSVNTINCTVFGYDPDIIFLDQLPNDLSVFENWISKCVEVHTFPDDIGLVSKNILFSMNVSYSSNLSFVTYKDVPELKDIWYIYIPSDNGKFQRINGFVSVSDRILPFDRYDWVLLQSQPQFDVGIEIFDPNYKLTQVTASRCNITFSDDSSILGRLDMYILKSSFEMFRAELSGFGKFQAFR